ncbi:MULTISPECIES: hypothetical protein [Clavibacter]|uniref:Uncharacterized protein n=1 Tax=Clavibacter tessellarius TaxID=31965 RepID=A0A154V1G8_9MICO|nr:hypothetical protein [Clavibacter michiganensis]KZC95191.1 hypothetical protein AWH51_09385 [Clavibacter michiganensis subsp. tessellarius]
MPRSEQQIIQNLIEKWIPLALEYAAGAPGVSTLYIYAGSELGGKYANAFFEQHGDVVYPGRLDTPQKKPGMVFQMQELLLEDLNEAEREFKAAGIPCPTEYRVTYEPDPGRLDVQLSHELKYANHPTKILEEGPEDWLDGRLEKRLGKLTPTEQQRRELQ